MGKLDGFCNVGGGRKNILSHQVLHLSWGAQLLKRAEKLGKLVSSRLLEMKEKYPLIGDVRGIGLMQAVELVRNRKTKTPAIKEVDRILEKSYKNGLILLPCGTSGIRFIPPLVIEEDELKEGLNIFEKALKSVK